MAVPSTPTPYNYLNPYQNKSQIAWDQLTDISSEITGVN